MTDESRVPIAKAKGRPMLHQTRILEEYPDLRAADIALVRGEARASRAG